MAQKVLDAILSFRAPAAKRLEHKDVRGVCAETHVLCVQELLSHDAQRFFDRLGEGTFISRFRDHNWPSLWPAAFRGSGLGIASRSKLVNPNVYHYRSSGSGWDTLARKGTLHAQVHLEGGLIVDVVNTHLQAGDDRGAVQVRKEQLRELTTLLRDIGAPDRPAIVCGDFNIDGLRAARSDGEYQTLSSALLGFTDLGAQADLATFEPHPEGNTLAHLHEPFGQKRRIDYVFFRAATEKYSTFRPTKVERLFDRPLAAIASGLRWFASDHFGLSASFEYERA